MASLFVIRGADQGRRFDLEDAPVTVGREATNGIQLNDTEVSRRHAEIRRVEGVDMLIDLGSSNGVFCNGRPITEHPLDNGDQIQFGRTLVLYTRPANETERRVAEQINITSDATVGEPSRIVHSITQEEGSRFFEFEYKKAHHDAPARADSILRVMYHTALAISHTLDIDQLLSRLMDLIFEWVEADRGCIMLVDPETKEFVPKVRRLRDDASGNGDASERMRISKTILDYVRNRNEGVLTSDAREDERWSPGASIVQMGVREAICVPMQGRYDVVGVIYIDTLIAPQDLFTRSVPGRPTNKFDEDHLKLMVSIAHQAALALEDTRYYLGMVQAERLAAIGQTVASLAHHIKNILQGIRGGSYLIEMGLDKHNEEFTRKGWNIVEKNQTKISNLVLDMLTFSKEREPELAEADVNETVDDVVELMRSRAEEVEVRLQWTPDPAMPTLVFDPEGLHRAVTNIVTNAIDAAYEAERDGWVRLSTRFRPEQKRVDIVCEDNGHGIAPEEMDSLFSPFISKKGWRGTGLGLPVSKKILDEHGGDIRVDSTLGEGACFTIELPVVYPDSSMRTAIHEAT